METAGKGKRLTNRYGLQGRSCCNSKTRNSYRSSIKERSRSISCRTKTSDNHVCTAKFNACSGKILSRAPATAPALQLTSELHANERGLKKRDRLRFHHRQWCMAPQIPFLVSPLLRKHRPSCLAKIPYHTSPAVIGLLHDATRIQYDI